MTLPSSFAKKIRTAGASGLALSLGFAAIPLPATAVNGGGEYTCDGDNTVIADLDPEVNREAIQALVDAAEPYICLEGDFILDGSIIQKDDPDITYQDVHFYGIGNSSLTVAYSPEEVDDPYLGSFIDFDNWVDGNQSKVTIENLTIFDSGGSSGGAVRAFQVEVISSTFMNNFTTSYPGGGAISAYNVEISDSTFIENEAFDDDGVGGGAIFAYQQKTVKNSTFRGNSAMYGGAIFGRGGTTLISNSTFESNTAYGGEIDHGGGEYDPAHGGAILGGIVYIENSTFVDNVAEGFNAEGGAIWATAGTVFFTTFVNNQALPSEEAEEDLGINIFFNGIDYPEIPGNAIYRAGEDDFELGGNIFAGTDSSPQLGIGEEAPPSPPARFIDLGGNVFSTDEEPDLIFYVEDDDNLDSHPTTLFEVTLTELFGSATPSLDDHEPNSSGTQVLALAAGSPAIGAVNEDLEFIAELLEQEELVDDDGKLIDQRGATRTAPYDAGSVEFYVAVVPPTSDSATSPPATAPLAKTGSDGPWWLSGLTVAMLTLGAVAIGARRKLSRLIKIS